MSARNERVRCTSEHMGVEVGTLGTLVFGADYVPGWDAGRWTVRPDSFPEASPYGHLVVNYWTADEMYESWEPVPTDD